MKKRKHNEIVQLKRFTGFDIKESNKFFLKNYFLSVEEICLNKNTEKVKEIEDKKTNLNDIDEFASLKNDILSLKNKALKCEFKKEINEKNISEKLINNSQEKIDDLTDKNLFSYSQRNKYEIIFTSSIEKNNKENLAKEKNQNLISINSPNNKRLIDLNTNKVNVSNDSFIFPQKRKKN